MGEECLPGKAPPCGDLERLDEGPAWMAGDVTGDGERGGKPLAALPLPPAADGFLRSSGCSEHNTRGT